MASTNPGGFTMYDLLTRVLPGLVSLGAILLIYDAEAGPIDGPSITATNLLIIGFVSYIFGEFTHLLRETFRPTPPAFRRVIYHETRDSRHLGVFQRLIQKIQTVYHE